MGKVKYGADLDLELVARHWLTKDRGFLKQVRKEFQYEAIIEVPLSEADRRAVDMMAVVADDLDANTWWDTQVDAEQFLVTGSVLEVGGNLFYKQG
jgi:hypothetical protein